MARFFACPVCAKKKIQVRIIIFGDTRSCPVCGSSFNFKSQISTL